VWLTSGGYGRFKQVQPDKQLVYRLIFLLLSGIAFTSKWKPAMEYTKNAFKIGVLFK